jgi:TatD DNase family protein
LEQFLNFHTHSFLESSNEKSIYSIFIHDFQQAKPRDNQWISAGVHPWYATPDWKNQLKEIESLATSPNVVAIGECGLDRMIDLPLDEQLLLFDAQVQLAQRLQKPVVIHCVRAFDTLISWKKSSKCTIPLVIHGFNNKSPIVKQLLNHGFYISLGAALLQPQSNASHVLKEIPPEKLFLENDNRDVPILEIYEIAANQLEISVIELKNQIWTNFAGIIKQ